LSLCVPSDFFIFSFSIPIFCYCFRVLHFIVYSICYDSWLSTILLFSLFVRSQFFTFSFHIPILVLVSCFTLYCLFHLITVLTLYDSPFDTLSSFRIFHLFNSYRDFCVVFIFCLLLFISFDTSIDSLRFYFSHSLLVLNFLSFYFISRFWHSFHFVLFIVYFIWCQSWISTILLLTLCFLYEFFNFSFQLASFVSFSCFPFYCLFHLMPILTFYDSMFDTLCVFRIVHRFIFYPDFLVWFSCFAFYCFFHLIPIVALYDSTLVTLGSFRICHIFIS
jgi:hypothetical protein